MTSMFFPRPSSSIEPSTVSRNRRLCQRNAREKRKKEKNGEKVDGETDGGLCLLERRNRRPFSPTHGAHVHMTRLTPRRAEPLEPQSDDGISPKRPSHQDHTCIHPPLPPSLGTP
ncbi:hypothetical protein CDEST_03045 [Colletotrichum destructivum]|uniref:Uncharacterized protein n=1 Tax=Colletotrichum destructivum TaxID=34406 RepID=A0AAX4I491_9PEZI|nr:hypothetical protein CDEST_03045 [Colletotrichum destructivum]